MDARTVRRGAPRGAAPAGRRLRYAIGELLTCTRCTGAWGALGLVALRAHAPAEGRLLTSVLAVSAGNDFLHSTFSWLCALGNTESERTELTMLDHRDRDRDRSDEQERPFARHGGGHR